MTSRPHDEIAMTFARIACQAGQTIMQSRAAGAVSRIKPDGSPVTQADLDADRYIRDALLRALPGMAIVTEESSETHTSLADDRFVLVDPLDGTREFVAGRDEFTVNIALIESGVPVAGAIYAPAMNKLYIAGDGAWRADVAPGAAIPPVAAMTRLQAARVPQQGWRAVASRSHLDPETQRWLDVNSVSDVCTAGSSLKFCAVAAGEADVYPRLSPTMEWDTAAGHAILLAAGGVVERSDGLPLLYGKHAAGFCNPAFVAWGRR